MSGYESLFTQAEINTYRRVKFASMRYAKVVREVLVEMVPGAYLPKKGKQFVFAAGKRYRVVNGSKTTNSTEASAEARMGVEVLDATNDADLIRFFNRAGLHPRTALADFRHRVAKRFA